MKKRFLALFLCVIMVIGVSPVNFDVSVFAENFPTSGTCGDNVFWEYNIDSQTLFISGTGAMDTYGYGNFSQNYRTTAPWAIFYDTIKTVIVNNGVTEIGYAAFSGCNALTSVTIPDSVTIIGGDAFQYCYNLENIEMSENIKNIGISTFKNCRALTSVCIPDSVEDIKFEAFYDCRELKTIIIGTGLTRIGMSAFAGCGKLTDVYFYSKNVINMYSYNTEFQKAKKHYYTFVDATVTCLEAGMLAYSYWSNTDPIEYIDEPVSMNALGHDIIHHTGKASTCKVKGYTDYDTCSRCDYTTYSELPLADHTPAAAVTENEVKATCTEDGSYDSVVYCSVCGDELSRENQTENALNHDIIHNNGKPSTCKEKGYADYDTCSRCDYTTYSELPLADHAPATAVKENTVAATCTENGSYDKVIYCSVCGDELSRKTETTVKTDHKDKNNDGVCDICGTVTDTAKHNAYLLGKAKINVKSSATVDYRSTVTVTATASGLPEGYVLAVYEGSTLKAKGSATSVSYNAGELMGNKTFTVKVVNSGNTPQKDSSGKEVNKTVEVKVKSGFFDKLIAFFRNLFGSLPKVEIKP